MAWSPDGSALAVACDDLHRLLPHRRRRLVAATACTDSLVLKSYVESMDFSSQSMAKMQRISVSRIHVQGKGAQ